MEHKINLESDRKAPRVRRLLATVSTERIEKF